MALLQNEDFLIWQLRTSYLTHIKDGVGERLITVDSSILNDPSFRAAGWSASAADVKRTYSPPIPTAIASDYFTAPPRSAGLAPPGFNDEDEEGGMVTGHGSTDTVGPGPNIRRRRRREQHEEEDSSDLSDESEEEVDESRAAQQIKFSKMPVRHRAGSSPIRSSVMKEGIEVLVTSPSRPSGNGRLRRGSLGAVEAIKQRARRDTTTSSDMSSENELDPSVFKRRQLNPTKAAKASALLTEKYKEDERQNMRSIDEDSAEGSDASSLSSGFLNAADSESLLDDLNPLTASVTSARPTVVGTVHDSPKKLKPPPSAMLQAPIPKRPISTVVPRSILGQAIKAQKSTPKNPVELFARLSGKGVPNPLNIRIYASFSESPTKPFEMPLQRTTQDSESGETPQVTVADAIGLSLWRYIEEQYNPPIEPSQLNVNRWALRMVEDGEVDYDFPPLTRTRPISDFTSNNNRGPRGRSREKPYDSFALVKASDAEIKEHQKSTPKYDQQFAAAQEQAAQASPQPKPSADEAKDPPSVTPELPAAVRKLTAAPLERPVLATQHSTPRMGPPKMLRIHFRSLEAYSQNTTIEVTTDTYLAEVLDAVCKKWKLDKAYHHLRVTGTRTIAPVDRTVESIGTHTDLDLERRRFVNEGAVGLSGSPGSSSPNAPLFLKTDLQRRGGKRMAPMLHPLAQKQDLPGSTGRYKKYMVFRKQPMSFTSHHQYNLILDDEYMHAIPAESARTLSNEKARRIRFNEIVGCKQSSRHGKQFKVVVLRENTQKRYDFIAQTAAEAAEIVEETSRGMEPYHHNDIPDFV
ncbi:MAG: hypothetical protein LQ344_002900 [Seirophora lacunosa]|nr:MAG: hypothetical protein LQ344_002900 [Seirophora lacunosa]